MKSELLELIEKTKLNFCCKLFKRVKEREGSLSAMEAFSLEIISSMPKPTVSNFARMTGISQPNASYKIQSLMKKGYILKSASEIDKREIILTLTDKYYEYSKLYSEDLIKVTQSIKDELTKDECMIFEKVLKKILVAFEQKA